MRIMGHTSCAAPPVSQTENTLVTTLYDVVEAVADELGPVEDRLVALIVSHLLTTARASWVNTPQRPGVDWDSGIEPIPIRRSQATGS